ncbi:hypothetical protein MLD38_008461 [Melastoma candidum]|uniref:Uncharacterized protein n=1 Tax=Melastoma candidum TaxID=119954 RepID=A0ACB9RY45_9MYRT|nr:hypothetical protein MLD38_008461 [Melastoma candidum]
MEVVSSETIKPSFPTPAHLRSHKLCLCDQLSPVFYIPLVLYYPMPHALVTTGAADVTRRLKSSLSLVLARFYPLAGRIKDNFLIECNDEGVKFVETRADCRLSELLVSPDPSLLNMLLPIEMESPEASTGFLFLVQVNFFTCGGLAMGMCISHKVADGFTLSDLITSWAKLSTGEEIVSKPPRFDASTFFPPSSCLQALPVVELPKEKSVTRRFVFDPSNISELVAMARSEHVPHPTRLEVVCALIWRCVTLASRRSTRAFGERSVFSQAVNIRPRMSPPLSESTVGDLVVVFLAEAESGKGEDDLSLRELVRKLREEKEEFLGNFMRKEMAGEAATGALLRMAETVGGLLKGGGVELYSSSSWCGFPVYDADFGWGKPVWVSLVSMAFKNTIIIMNKRGGEGMEVWLTLTEDHMAEVDRDEEVHRLATVNPGIDW